MIDLHGAPGSQNGFDNSGRRGGADWANNYNNVQRTRDVIYQLTKKYSQAQCELEEETTALHRSWANSS
jgi:glucan 1,3-beta-glucosidase